MAAPFFNFMHSMSIHSLIYILLLCCPLMAQEFSGLVVAVFDGDTIKVLDSQKRQLKIRLDAIDAPEKGQPYSALSKKYLSSLVSGRTVRIVSSGTDRYGRTIGTVFIGKQNINLMVVEAGYAWHYVYFAEKKTEYAAAEARAKKARRGLWADTAPPIPPWDFRKVKKSK